MDHIHKGDINLHYLDNSATTQVCQKSAQKALYMMRECFANPSSLHSLGFSAEKELRNAREIILNSLSSDGDIIFTSGGTESNNLAIMGAVEQNKRNGNKIVTSLIEHPSVSNVMKELEKKGFEVIYLKPDEFGNISKSQIYDAVTSDTILVSLMSVNNETGAILPLEAVAPAIKRCNSKAYFHVDNVQGFQKIKLNLKALGVNLMSVSSHKVHGLKGTGALYISKGTRIKPILFGGGQEKNIRSGTENIVGITAFAVAVEENIKDFGAKELNNYLREKVSKIDGVTINSPENASPYILNISLGKIKGETMLHFLSAKEIYVSTGSACSGANHSSVLTAMGLSRDRIESSIRISFSKESKREDIDALIDALNEGVQSIAHV